MLIDDVSQGKNKANKIYVLLPESTKKDVVKSDKKKKKRKTMLDKKKEVVKKLNTSIKVKRILLDKLCVEQTKIKELAKNKPELTISPAILTQIKERVEYDYFIDNEKDIGISKETIETLIYAIAEMETAETTLIGGVYYTSNQLKERLNSLDSCVLLEFLPDFYSRVRLRDVRNLKAYIKTSLIRYLEHFACLLSGVYYKPQKAKSSPSYEIKELTKGGLYLPV